MIGHNVSFDEANLRHTNFSGADLTGADLDDTRLDHANLSGAILTGALAVQSHLVRADLTNINATGAVFLTAFLGNADLSGANLSGADLCEADLQGANVWSTNFEGAVYDFGTTWPDEPNLFQVRLEGPPRDAILDAKRETSLDNVGIIYLGFGPARFPAADFVAIPKIYSLDQIEEDPGCAYIRFADFMEVMAPKIREREDRTWYAPPEISREVLEQVAEKIIPVPRGGHILSGVDAERLGHFADVILEPFESVGYSYMLSGIDLREPEDLELYRQLLARKVEPPPARGLYECRCTEMVHHMRTWYDL